jgi:hypothetical protein
MTSITEEPTGSSIFNPGYRPQAGTGRFMLTLCPLAAPVSIRPPQSPQLKPFSFFMSRAYRPDGSERLYLHMGYFDTLAAAERWADSVRRHYPSAFASLAPAAFLRPADYGAASLSPGEFHPVVPLQSSDPAPVKDESLTDTQVLKILAARRGSTVQGDLDESNYDQIALLRPEDTGIRQALKEAVVQGAPVTFAVQLLWSAQPIDLSRVRSPAIFKSHTVYATESHRKGRSLYFLRLGFFADPISAKQVAVQVRSAFDLAAVVPVVEPEITRAREAASGTAAIPYLVDQRVDRESDTSSTLAPTQSTRRLAGAAMTVDETPETLGEREMWTEPDSLSESGVRHLRVEVQEHLSGRWKVVRLRSTPPNMAQV